MRKLFATVSLGLLLITGAGAGPARSGDVTFKLTDQSSYSIIVKFFSQTRTWSWPTATTHWTLADTGEHAFHLACQNGEKICYGGAFDANDKTYWGVGFKGDRPCTDCCLTCGSNVSHAWNLAPQASNICVECKDGSCQCGVGTQSSLCASHKGIDPKVGCTGTDF